MVTARTRFLFSDLSLYAFHHILFVELPENWTDTRETIVEGMTFNLHHLGMTLVDQPKGEDLSAAAVKRIVATVSAGVSLFTVFHKGYQRFYYKCHARFCFLALNILPLLNFLPLQTHMVVNNVSLGIL